MFTKEQQLKKNKKPKQKRCKECKKLFTPERELQPCCSYDCNIKHLESNLKGLVNQGKTNRKKEARKQKSELDNNDKSMLRRKVQAVANRYGKLMDYPRWKEEGCITCGIKTGKVDGGHFLPTSKYPSIRYFAKQIKGQCIRCNQYNNGMPLEYDSKMRELYGNNFVDKLRENHRKSANYSVEYMQKYIRIIGKRIKKLELRYLEH